MKSSALFRSGRAPRRGDPYSKMAFADPPDASASAFAPSPLPPRGPAPPPPASLSPAERCRGRRAPRVLASWGRGGRPQLGQGGHHVIADSVHERPRVRLGIIPLERPEQGQPA